MPEADLDAVIRQLAKAQNKSLMGAAKKRSAFYMAKAGEGQGQGSQDAAQAAGQERDGAWPGGGQAAAKFG